MVLCSGSRYDEAMKLYLVRHGRTNYNDLHICNYDPAVDVHLTAVGIEQAEAVARRLKDVQLDRIMASELKRTRQTAEIINQFHHLPIEIDRRLDEHRSGFEGRPFKELKDALEAAPNRWTARFNGGESIEDIKVRAGSFIDELRTRSYDAVLVVTSQWVVYSILAVVRGMSNEETWKLEVEPGSCTELEI